MDIAETIYAPHHRLQLKSEGKGKEGKIFVANHFNIRNDVNQLPTLVAFASDPSF
jgi:hypothetical protein